MKKIIKVIVWLCLMHQLQVHGQPTKLPTTTTNPFRHPNWGPYSKKYFGISHVPDFALGWRFDLSFSAGHYARRNSPVPSVEYESGTHNQLANADLSFFKLRQNIEGHDLLYCDQYFYSLDSHTTKVVLKLENQTNNAQRLCFNVFANMNFPPLQPYSDKPIVLANVVLPKNSVWIDATHYTTIHYRTTYPQAELVYDKQIKGEQRTDSAVNGVVIGYSWKGKAWGTEPGDRLHYYVNLPATLKNAGLIIRYRLTKGQISKIKLKGLINKTITLTGTGSFAEHKLDLGKITKGNHLMVVESADQNPVELDGYAVYDAKGQAVNFTTTRWQQKPKVVISDSNYVIFKYNNLPGYYGLAWHGLSFAQRFFYADYYDKLLKSSLNKFNNNFYNQTEITGEGTGCYFNLFAGPILLNPNSVISKQMIATYGSLTQVKKTIQKYKFVLTDCSNIATQPELDNNYNQPADEYKLGYDLLKATTLTNLVYPVYTHGKYISHYAPGKIWDCLYTWDNGFIGLGLASLNRDLAIQNLALYTSDTAEQSAFTHHGTPLPTQIYQYKYLWEQTNDLDFLAYFYPRLKRYYNFMCGHIQSSTMRMPSNLIRSFDYFYNSGGWDDYPAQVFVHNNGLAQRVAPMVSTAHVIRMAKILKQAASELNYHNDVHGYNNDIELLGNAVLNHAYDTETGYFGYVIHDTNGHPTGILRDSLGQNLNMGLDGLSPLVAGIGSALQVKQMVTNLFDSNQIWSAAGLSTVNQSSPYFLESGYWNGNVWLPHQWFFFKAMLDVGLPNRALQIAQKALQVFNKQATQNYYCYEAFSTHNGQGVGYHQFSGLSSPVLLWYQALFKPGTLTAGFNTWISHKQWHPNFEGLTANLIINANPNFDPAGLCCLNQDFKFEFTINGESVPSEEVLPGLWQFLVPMRYLNQTIELKAHKIK